MVLHTSVPRTKNLPRTVYPMTPDTVVPVTIPFFFFLNFVLISELAKIMVKSKSFLLAVSDSRALNFYLHHALETVFGKI